ncbi:hypothetical protein DL766_000569 [Monosporascus sp. MC13-8B]|nr:hypothetical protein DL766_000569 [Monosporascus sp. MC13-8B]
MQTVSRRSTGTFPIELVILRLPNQWPWLRRDAKAGSPWPGVRRSDLSLIVMPSIVFVGLSMVVVPPEAAIAKRYANSSNAFGPLTFKADGTFQISIFEDLHFGENAWDSWGPQQDINSVKVIDKLLTTESPDLVVLNGDLITGENGYLENATHYIDQIVEPLVERGLSWASAYGNHDHQFNLSAADILARERVWPNSRTRRMVAGEDVGVSNYYLPVYDPRCREEKICVPELLLWFFDSKGGFRFQQKDAYGKQVGIPNWVDHRVAQWWYQTNAELVQWYQQVIPSLAFVHIPTYASYALQQAGVDPYTEPGINDDNPLAPQAQGWCPDGRDDGTCSYGGQDIPFMQAITATKGLMAVFSGHDHGDTWCYKWDSLLPGMTVAGNGVNLCFGQHTGYGGYGNWERGARQVLVTKEQLRACEVDTWIRLESGNVVSQIPCLEGDSRWAFDIVTESKYRDYVPGYENGTDQYCQNCRTWNRYGRLNTLPRALSRHRDHLDMGYKQFITPGYEAVRIALVDIGHVVFQGDEVFIGQCFNSEHRHYRPGELRVLEDRALPDYGVTTVDREDAARAYNGPARSGNPRRYPYYS